MNPYPRIIVAKFHENPQNNVGTETYGPRVNVLEHIHIHTQTELIL